MITAEVVRRAHELQRRSKRGAEGPSYDELDDRDRARHDASVTRAIASYHRVTAREVPLR